MESEEVQQETIVRLVDQAIAAAVRGAPVAEAGEELCTAAGSNPALLTAAATTARRLNDDAGGTDYVDAAITRLEAARETARSRSAG